MAFKNTTPKTSLDALAVGRTPSDPFVDEFEPRDPTPSDVYYPIQKKWFNTSTEAYWMLIGFSSMGGFVSAIWIQIGAGGGYALRKVGVDSNTPPGTNPVFSDFSGLITVTGNQVAAGTTNRVIRTDSLAPNQYTIEIQRSQAVASSTVGDNGVSHFDSTDFTVDSNGFVQLSTGSRVKIGVDNHTAPGTDPVVPDGTGLITVTGGQIAAGSTPNVIRTDSLAANTYTIEVQRSQAVATSTLADNGVSHFDNNVFSVDANGFVSLATSFYSSGTFTPVLSFGGASVGITYAAQVGKYFKIGNLVTFSLGITLTNKGSSTGNASVGTLPFPAVTGANATMNATEITLPSDTYQILGEIGNGSSDVLLDVSSGTSPGTTSALMDTNFLNNTSFQIEGSYYLD